MVDTRDLKSLAGSGVPVRVRERAPKIGGVPGIGYGADCKSVLCGFESHRHLQAGLAQLVEQLICNQ